MKYIIIVCDENTEKLIQSDIEKISLYTEVSDAIDLRKLQLYIKKLVNEKDAKIHYRDNVEMTEKQYFALIKEYGEIKANKMLDTMNDYAEQIGTLKFKAKYKSHFHTLKNWERKNLEKFGKIGKSKVVSGEDYGKFTR